MTQPAVPFRQNHRFDQGNPQGERGTRWVVVITLLTMAVEIAAGLATNSMALLADGIHMSSHALAIGLSAFAYAMARRYASDTRFAFGTWKIEILGGFASALFLLAASALMVWTSLERLWNPKPIAYIEAMGVAFLGLLVNLLCAWILGRAQQGHGHSHSHSHSHAHSHGHGHGSHAHDLNLKGAYLHVLADAATSVLAIAALAGGLWWGWNWLDPVMGLGGAVLVTLWAVRLLKDSSRVLLDCEMDHPVVEGVRASLLEKWGDAIEITDLHVWRAGRKSQVCILSLATRLPINASDVRHVLMEHSELSHITVEIEHL